MNHHGPSWTVILHPEKRKARDFAHTVGCCDLLRFGADQPRSYCYLAARFAAHAQRATPVRPGSARLARRLVRCRIGPYWIKAAPLRSAAARRRAGLCLGRPAWRTPGQHAQTPAGQSAHRLRTAGRDAPACLVASWPPAATACPVSSRYQGRWVMGAGASSAPHCVAHIQGRPVSGSYRMRHISDSASQPRTPA
jgi:hypothetical protein